MNVISMSLDWTQYILVIYISVSQEYLLSGKRFYWFSLKDFQYEVLDLASSDFSFQMNWIRTLERGNLNTKIYVLLTILWFILPFRKKRISSECAK